MNVIDLDKNQHEKRGVYEETKKSQNLNIEYVWKNLTVMPRKTCNKIFNLTEVKPKIMLENVFGKVQSGETLAILGGSGSGKTTLLNCLSKKNNPSNLNVEGEILINNKSVNETVLNSISSYVMQDDFLLSDLTPTEILLFTAKMKLNNHSEKEIEEKVNEMIMKLNLQICRNTKIGDQLNRGLSGGERKRTSIAVELITNPYIVYLDEPTTGLDSFNAFEVVKFICKMAKDDNKLIIFTIHQPSSEVFELLDKICILADGKLIYFGPQKDSLDYFKDVLNLPCPDQYNPFEHFMEITTLESIFKDETKRKYQQINVSYQDPDVKISEAYSNYMKNLSEIFYKNKEKFINLTENFDGFSDELEELIQNKTELRELSFQYKNLLGRNLIISYRNKKLLFLKVFQNVLTSLIESLLYQKLSHKDSGIQDRFGLIFSSITTGILGTCTYSLFTFADEKKIYLREQSGKLYSIPAYFFAKLTCEIFTYFITINCFIILIYNLSNLNDTYGYKYFSYVGVMQLSSFSGLSYSMFLGSLVTDQNSLTNLLTFFIIPLMLLSGYFASSTNFVFYMKPLEYISTFKYSYQILSEIEFSDIQPLNCYFSEKGCHLLKGRIEFKESITSSLMAIIILCLAFLMSSLLILLYKGKYKS